MQLKHALLPIAVLAGSGIFLAKRQFAATEKRHSMVIFRETIRTVTEHRTVTQAAAAAKAGAEAKKAAMPEVVTRASIDLKMLAGSMGAMQRGGFPDMQAMVKMQKSLLGLPAEDFSQLITDAGRLDLPEDQKNGLLMMLLQGLTQKDPKAAVLAGRELSRNAGGSQMTMLNMGGVRPAFAAWAKQDPAAAVQWYDAEVAAGHFENKGLNDVDQARTQFESAVLPGLAAKDPAAASARLLAMPEAQRMSVLSSSTGFAEDAASHKAFASLVRGTLPPEKQADALGSMAASMQNGTDFKNVSEFLASTAVTPAEKEKILPQVAGSRLRNMAWGFSEPLTYENAVPVRKWMEEQQPGSSGKAMGESLAAVTGTGKFDQGKALALVTRLYDEDPSDELITSFLDRSKPQGNPELYRPLAAKIQDPAQRRKILDLLSGRK
ncbi:MAG: hypothetical protein V4726_02010 [Verrucomicrobiota bacterium]